MFVKCDYLIQLKDFDHLLCPYVQKSTDSKRKLSHMNGSFHVVLKAVILQEKSAEVSRRGISCSQGTDEPHLLMLPGKSLIYI